MRPGADGAAEGSPYASLVLVACGHDAAPILLISDLADHTRNAKADARASLLFDGTLGLDDPLTGARVSLLGRLAPSDDPGLRARFLGRHPSAAMYADFADFGFYRLDLERAHLVAGFGAIHWIDAGEVLYDDAGAAALAAAEAEIVAHMNADHADAVALIAGRALGRPAEAGWTMTGVDPEGCDLRLGDRVVRAAFDKPVSDAEQARVELVRLTKRARRQAERGG